MRHLTLQQTIDIAHVMIAAAAVQAAIGDHAAASSISHEALSMLRAAVARANAESPPMSHVPIPPDRGLSQ